MQKLIDSEALRKEMGEAGRNWVIQNFDWKNSVEAMIQHYHEALIPMNG